MPFRVLTRRTRTEARGVINGRRKGEKAWRRGGLWCDSKDATRINRADFHSLEPHSLNQESYNVTSSHAQAILSIHAEWHLTYLATGFGREASTRTSSSYLGDGAQPVNKTDLSTVCARVVISPQRSRFSALLHVPALLLYPPQRQPVSCRGKAA